MDEFWLEKARKYILEHRAFTNVSAVKGSSTGTEALISATVSVGLPSKFIKLGITETGVRSKEEVKFVFTEEFPLKAPCILLRNDFPRCSPHINPSVSDVVPCIYEGDLSELLQQSEWMNGILNQLVDWLEKAASNDLMNYDQGWEPMRNDHCAGFILYDLDKVIDACTSMDESQSIRKVKYEEYNERVFVYSADGCNKGCRSHMVCLMAPEVVPAYIPNSIETVGDLYEYAESIGVHNIQKRVEEIDRDYMKEDKLFLVLSVKRPVKLIGSHTDRELLNFVICKQRRKGKEKRYRVLPECSVGMLVHIEDRSSALLRRLSGSRAVSNEGGYIALVGCGSLGSKIGMHLARNGNGPFLCIDDDIFMPHNNARHALIQTSPGKKANLLSDAIIDVGGISVEAARKSALNTNFSSSRIIIDTTASLSVRSFLMDGVDLPPIISGCLYGRGRYGLLLLEGRSKTSRLSDIWAHLYYRSLLDSSLQMALFSAEGTSINIGQSCSSRTMVVDDARISLMAATMSLRIQAALEDGLPKHSKALFIEYHDNYSLTTHFISIPECVPVNSTTGRDWQVRLSRRVHEEMKRHMLERCPDETGGVLVGSVFLYARTVVVTGVIPAPLDSIEERDRFVLGIDGLKRAISSIEQKTNGKVTYLGTWHSHPLGGGASLIDKATYQKLVRVRRREPTVCLIVSHDEVFLV